MKTAALLLAASALFSASVFAQSVPSTPALPPPGINDPGVQTVEPVASAPASATTAPRPLNLKPQALPAMHEPAASQSGDPSVPEIRIRQVDDQTVQEYSRNGRVYMVVVTPKSGLQQTYMVDPQGRLVDEHGKKPVGPAMYKVLEWGKSRPPAESPRSSGGDDSGN